MIKVFTGQAGTGKTTKVINQLTSLIETNHFQEHHCFLAITFMHGSRKRLESNLKLLKHKYNINFQCMTIDSFVLSIVNKFRTYIDIEKLISINTLNNDVIELSISEIQIPLVLAQKYAIQLLSIKSVTDYIGNSYPTIIIDEFQDCEGQILEIIKRLSTATDLLIATDPFQYLSNEERSDSYDWLETVGAEINDLNGKIWRTNNKRILNTAFALRSNKKDNNPKVNIMACPSHYVGSAILKTNIYYGFLSGGTIAIISPSSAPKSRFVNKTMELQAKPHIIKSGINKGKSIGPYDHLISSVKKSDLNEICPEIMNRDYTKEELHTLTGNNHYIVRHCAEVALKRINLRGADTIEAIEFDSILEQSKHTFDNFIVRDNNSKIVFTSIHGAKNREFDHVIVLWPYEVSGESLYKRKLLYNAITRAKRSVVVLVQHKTNNRDELKEDPLFDLIIN